MARPMGAPVNVVAPHQFPLSGNDPTYSASIMGKPRGLYGLAPSQVQYGNAMRTPLAPFVQMAVGEPGYPQRGVYPVNPPAPAVAPPVAAPVAAPASAQAIPRDLISGVGRVPGQIGRINPAAVPLLRRALLQRMFRLFGGIG